MLDIGLGTNVKVEKDGCGPEEGPDQGDGAFSNYGTDSSAASEEK